MRFQGFAASLAAMLALLAGCTAEPVAPALTLETEAVPGGTRLFLISPPGTRINAGVKPALELRDGRIIHFDTAAVTADSLYFSAPPTALLQAPAASAHGLLRASICDDGAAVCRLVRVEI